MSDEGREQREWLPPGMLAAAEEADLEEAAEYFDDEEEDDEDLEEAESYGADIEPSWSPVPLAKARAFLRANPSAQIDLVFPESYAEDRSAKLKDILTAEASGVLSHHRAADMIAVEFGLEYDYDSEMAAIRQEKAKYPDILGAGDALASRIAGGPALRPPSLADEDERELLRHDLSAPERRRFKKQQREGTRIVFIERDQRGRIRELVEEPGAVETPAPPPLDRETLVREMRLDLQRKREEEAKARVAATPESDDPAAAELQRAIAEGAELEDLSPGLRRQILVEGRELAQEIRQAAEPLPEGPTLTKKEVRYRWVDVMHELSLGHPLAVCATCVHFRPPGTPSEPGACEIVIGPIRGVDVCDKFKRKAAQ